MTSLPPNADELVSAYVDGDATPEEVAVVEASPELVARVRELQALAARVGNVSPPSATTRESHLGAAMAAFDEIYADDDTRPFATAAPALATTDPPPSVVTSIDDARSARDERTADAASRRRNWRLPGVAAAAAMLAIVFAGIVALGFNSSPSSTEVADTAAADAPQVSSADLQADEARNSAGSVEDALSDGDDAAFDAEQGDDADDAMDEEEAAVEEAAEEAPAEEELADDDEAEAMADAIEEDESESAAAAAPDAESAAVGRGERVPPATAATDGASSSAPAPTDSGADSSAAAADDAASDATGDEDDRSSQSAPVPEPTATVEESLPPVPPASPPTADADDGTDEEAPFASGPAPSPDPFVDLGPFPDAGSFFETLSQVIAARPNLGTVEDAGLVGACDDAVELANGPTQFFGVADVGEDLVELYRAGDGKTVVVTVPSCQGLIP